LSAERIAAVLREIDADVVALQEVPLGGRGAHDVASALRDAGLGALAEGPTVDTAHRRYGNAVLSRWPIMAVRTVDLSFGSREPRGALDADLICHDQPLRIVATHLGLSPAERRHQIRRLLEVFDTVRMPVLLMGDISEWFVWGRPLRWLVSHFQAAPAPATFPSGWPVFALDRIWVRPRQRLLRVHVHASALARVASDHLPLVARIGAGA
jgi:endonuclease/exonuclease/phosphatase family metal-dependent hydrolase